MKILSGRPQHREPACGAQHRCRRDLEDRYLRCLQAAVGKQSRSDLLTREDALEPDSAANQRALDAAAEEALKWIAARPLYETVQLPADEEEILAVTPRYLNYRAYTIFGGSTEIQTTIMATSMLGL